MGHLDQTSPISMMPKWLGFASLCLHHLIALEGGGGGGLLFLFILSKIVQCSSDISELRIRVLYARILRIRVCLYAYTRMSIRVYAYVNTRVYVPLLCIHISFFV